MTKQRAVILEVIRSDTCHHTAEEIFDLAKQKLPLISRATVYNNLHSLEEEQIIRRIGVIGGPDRYDKSYIPHGHLFCTECDRIFDIDICGLNDMIASSGDCLVESYELKVNGVCSGCKTQIMNSGA